MQIHFLNFAPDDDLLIRSKYRALLCNQDMRNYSQISFIFGIVNYIQSYLVYKFKYKIKGFLQLNLVDISVYDKSYINNLKNCNLKQP